VYINQNITERNKALNNLFLKLLDKIHLLLSLFFLFFVLDVDINLQKFRN